MTIFCNFFDEKHFNYVENDIKFETCKIPQLYYENYEGIEIDTKKAIVTNLIKAWQKNVYKSIKNILRIWLMIRQMV